MAHAPPAKKRCCASSVSKVDRGVTIQTRLAVQATSHHFILLGFILSESDLFTALRLLTPRAHRTVSVLDAKQLCELQQHVVVKCKVPLTGETFTPGPSPPHPPHETKSNCACVTTIIHIVQYHLFTTNVSGSVLSQVRKGIRIPGQMAKLTEFTDCSGAASWSAG